MKKVVVHRNRGARATISLKHGTECADGSWTEVKAPAPAGVRTRDHTRIAEYVNAWAWRARRHGQNLFVALGEALSA